MAIRKTDEDILTAAIAGFEAQKSRINERIDELRGQLNGGASKFPAEEPTKRRGRRRMSAAARKRIPEAQRKRWAAQKGEAQPSKSPAEKPKRRLSAAGRRNIIEATRRRWALVRAQKAAAQKRTKAA